MTTLEQLLAENEKTRGRPSERLVDEFFSFLFTCDTIRRLDVVVIHRYTKLGDYLLREEPHSFEGEKGKLYRFNVEGLNKVDTLSPRRREYMRASFEYRLGNISESLYFDTGQSLHLGRWEEHMENSARIYGKGKPERRVMAEYSLGRAYIEKEKMNKEGEYRERAIEIFKGILRAPNIGSVLRVKEKVKRFARTSSLPL